MRLPASCEFHHEEVRECAVTLHSLLTRKAAVSVVTQHLLMLVAPGLVGFALCREVSMTFASICIVKLNSWVCDQTLLFSAFQYLVGNLKLSWNCETS